MGGGRAIRVRLLGGLAIEGIDHNALGSRKARLLLKRLAIARGATVASDELVDVLWGDSPPNRPHDQLGVLVSRLRRVLGAAAIPHRDAGYALVADWLDVDELAWRVDEASAASAQGRMAAAKASADAAIAIGRGALLPDDEGAWIDGERSWCAANVARAHHIAAEAALASGDVDAAAATSEAALRTDPFDETALRVLMRAHGAAARPASGLAAYVRVRDRLVAELGVSPTPETEAIHDALVLGQLASPPEAASDRSASGIVGRDEELAILDHELERARRGESVGVVIRGEPGIGKSALLEAWRASIGTSVTVIACVCDPLGRDLPLQPLIDGVARHLDVLGPAAADLVGDDASALRGLLGSMAAVAGATVARDPDLGRAELFGALLSVVGRLGDGPVVLAVEDLHNAGASTFEWISFALRRGQGLLVVATTRQSGGDIQAVREIRLGPLAPETAAELIAGAGDERRIAEIVARAGGNPLFLVALAAARGDDLPETVRQAVDRQAESLGTAAGTVRAAAIIGGPIDLDLLSDALAVPARDVLADLEAGWRAGLLEERPSGLAFRHDVVREALDAGAGSARRALVHRDVARVLGSRVPRDPLAIAVHARLGGEIALAVEAFVSAARAAAARFDVAAALDHLGAAIELAPDPSAYASRARVRLSVLDLRGAELDAAEAVALGGGAAALEVSAWVAYYQRRYIDAKAFADAGAAQAPDAALQLSCRAVGGRVRHGAGDLAGAAACLEGGAAAPEVRGVADVWLAHLRVHQGRPEEAIEIVSRALIDPDQLAHPWAALHGRFARVMALGQLARVEEALRGCDELEQQRRRAGEVGARFEGVVENMRGWLLRNVGCLGPADESNERALAAHREEARLSAVGFTEAYWAASLDLIDGRLLAGDLAGALQRLDATSELDRWEGTMAWHQRQRLGLLRARAALTAGDRDTALGLAEAVRADAAGRGSRRYELLAAAWVARADPQPDRDAVGRIVDGLEACARLEGCRLAAELAAQLGVDQWRVAAERMASGIVAASGEHRDVASEWFDRLLTPASPM